MQTITDSSYSVTSKSVFKDRLVSNPITDRDF